MAKLEIVRAEYQGLEVSFTENGWFNATVVAEKYGKRPVDWIRLDETQEYLKSLASMLTCEPESLVKTSRARSDRGGGTWLHPNLVVAFARWLSTDFAVWCDLQIHQILKGNHPHFDWKRLRHEACSSFKVMNDILKETRLEIGKATASHHYSNEARLINWALTGEFKALDRELLSIGELDVLAKLEAKNSVLIGRAVPYPDRKKILEQYAIDLRPAPMALALAQ